MEATQEKHERPKNGGAPRIWQLTQTTCGDSLASAGVDSFWPCDIQDVLYIGQQVANVPVDPECGSMQATLLHDRNPSWGFQIFTHWTQACNTISAICYSTDKCIVLTVLLFFLLIPEASKSLEMFLIYATFQELPRYVCHFCHEQCFLQFV